MKVHFLKRCLQCVSGGKLTLTKIPVLNLFTLEIDFFPPYIGVSCM